MKRLLGLTLLVFALPASAGAFIIADDKALVYRLQADRWDGISDMNDPAVVLVRAVHL